MRSLFKYTPLKKDEFISHLLCWANSKEVFSFLNVGPYEGQFIGENSFNSIVGIGKISELLAGSLNECDALKRYIDSEEELLMGFLSYDLKNRTEKLFSKNPDGVEMPLLHFFQPELIFYFSEEQNEIAVSYLPEHQDENQINALCKSIEDNSPANNFGINENIVPIGRVSKNEYLENVQKIKEHIQFGDVYELNYCIEFFAENVDIDPVQVYQKLSEISPAPFSCFYKVDNKYLISASPERFLKKVDKKIVAQPMKGTAGRSNNPVEDLQIKEQLFRNEKERAENVMIVDLVRNDLSKTAVSKSVNVEELFGIYTFPQVHQMVSTVSSEMRNDVHIVDVIKAAFPMGSMTGAPKVKAMELIEEFEITKRGLFSGSVGFVTAEKDFDFNVVIRSIQYNADKKYLSFMVGSAITIDSDPEKEYEECMLKAQALIEVLK